MNDHKVLTRQGYIISKRNLSQRQRDKIVKDLTVKPMLHPDFDVDDEPFKIYKENRDSYCMPRYYGVNNFGEPERSMPIEGDAIDIKFKGEMREYQKPIIEKCLTDMREKGGGILSLHTGCGKCLARGTQVLMFDCTTKNVEDIEVGDKLMGDDSKPRTVLSLARGRDRMYDVIPSVGEKYTVNEAHILSLKDNKEIIDISVGEYIKLLKNDVSTTLLGYRVPLELEQRLVEIEPYVLGYWLGGGETEDKELNERLKKLNMIDAKDIPLNYKRNTRMIRRELLAGLIDAKGYITDGEGYMTDESFNICLKQEGVIDDIIFIARSLGLGAYKTKECKNYKTNIHGDITMIPIRLGKHRISEKEQKEDVTVYRIKVVLIGEDEYFGFEIDGNRRFLLGDMTVTHNTVLAIKIACELGLKTLILVHKSFLQNQWYDRITQFTNARVGMIRQKKINVKNKDFVIGMIQSVSMIDYNLDIFADIGLIIVDECFVGKHKIVTDVGLIEIRKLYNMWANKDKLPLIKSFNETTKLFEYKKLNHAWKKEAESLVRVKLGKRSIICTPNHRFLTTNGYKEANELKTKDIIVGTYEETLKENIYARGLNEDQYQIILGSFMGNGNIVRMGHGRYRMSEKHGIDKKEYCMWKASMFGVKIKENGNTKKSAVHFITKVFDVYEDIPKSKTSCPQWIINKMDWRAIAIWIMDDGTINKIYSQIRISTCSFNEESQKRMVRKLRELEIECCYKKYGGYYYINIGEEGTKKTMSKIYKYFHPSMMKNKYTHKIDVMEVYRWNNEFKKYGTCTVSSVIPQQVVKRYKHVYDIEVEDNHNFIIGSINNAGPVVHNCHHVGSRVFSKSLYKTGSKYTLGLSATPYRNDGLTKILFWYLGEIMYKLERKADSNVLVKIFNYESDDKLFVEKKMWVKGKIKPAVPKMITNLHKIECRNKFLLAIIDNLRKQDDRKILVLSGRLDHLFKMKEAMDKILKEEEEADIIELDEYKTAYYIGKMKEYELRESAEAEIIFATYEMASEGLDINGLNTLVLATPKKNIIQSIGRIMRKPIKEGDIKPMIVDVIDQFSMFDRWGTIRRRYYEKNKYSIEYYQGWNEKCVSVRDYLIINGVVNEKAEQVDVRKEFICYKYGELQYELDEEIGFEGDDEKKYYYEPDLTEIFKVDYEYDEKKLMKELK